MVIDGYVTGKKSSTIMGGGFCVCFRNFFFNAVRLDVGLTESSDSALVAFNTRGVGLWLCSDTRSLVAF